MNCRYRGVNCLASLDIVGSQSRFSNADRRSLNIERSEIYHTACGISYGASRISYRAAIYHSTSSAARHFTCDAGANFTCPIGQTSLSDVSPTLSLNLTRSVRFHRREAAIFVHNYCRLTSLTLVILCNCSVRPLGFIRHRRRLGGSPCRDFKMPTAGPSIIH